MTPSMPRPIRMMPTPATRTMIGILASSADPMYASEAPNAVNTTVNPATNRSDDRNVTLRASRVPSSAVGRAVT